MDCLIDIQEEGKYVVSYLPFNPRSEFNIPKGSIYVKCVINDFEFKSKLVPRGNERYCILFNKQLLKSLDLTENTYLNVQLNIVPDSVTIPELAEPELLDNEVLKAIKARASIRKFSNKTVEKVQINTILNAGLCAPSATNKKPFHLIITENREKMLGFAEINPYAKMIGDAAACIIVCGDKVVQGTPELLIEDCSAVTQNMLLAIHSIGLGGVWCWVKQNSEFYKSLIESFHLPNHIRPVSLIALGYAAEEKVQTNRFQTNKIHFETW